MGEDVLDAGAMVGTEVVALVVGAGAGLSTVTGATVNGTLVEFVPFTEGETTGARVSLVDGSEKFAMTGAEVKAIVGGDTDGGSLVELDSLDESCESSPRSNNTLRTTAAMTTKRTTAMSPIIKLFRRGFAPGLVSS